MPDYSFEQKYHAEGYQTLCGIDEAGRGPLAGPVTAAAVILNPDGQGLDTMPSILRESLADSKKLSEKKRDQLFDAIMATSLVSIASISAQTIDRINIRQASLLAMQKAAYGLSIEPDFALIDGNALPAALPCPAVALVKGDDKSLSIAAASIIAKVMRDRLMKKADQFYPDYQLARHKGYPTRLHRDILIEKGPSPLHRQTFKPVIATTQARQDKK